MDPAALRAFARRDWDLIAQAKDDFWIAQKQQMSVADVLDLADQLRQYALSHNPGWPDSRECADDLAVHLRVSEALRAVAIRPR